MSKEKQDKHDGYNAEPVVYCADCLSLRIQEVDGIDYCDKCGSTNIGETSIFDWEKMYEAKYAGSYLNMK